MERKEPVLDYLILSPPASNNKLNKMTFVHRALIRQLVPRLDICLGKISWHFYELKETQQNENDGFVPSWDYTEIENFKEKYETHIAEFRLILVDIKYLYNLYIVHV